MPQNNIIRPSLIFEVTKQIAARYPSKECLISNSKVFSYRQFVEEQERFASYLINEFDKDARIALLLDNSSEFLIAFYGIIQAGMICVPVDPDMHPRNLAYIFNDCDVCVAIIQSRHLSKLFENISDFKNLNNIIFVGRNVDLVSDKISLRNFNDIMNLKACKVEMPCVNETDIASILYTTGTTGPKKGAMLSHKNMLAATRNINEFMGIGDWAREVIPIPLTHSFGLGRARCVFDVGGTIILEKGFLYAKKKF